MKKIMSIKEMTCEHCANRITRTIENINGVSDVAASISDKTVTITYDDDVYSLIKDAVLELGYTIDD